MFLGVHQFHLGNTAKIFNIWGGSGQGKPFLMVSHPQSCQENEISLHSPDPLPSLNGEHRTQSIQNTTSSILHSLELPVEIIQPTFCLLRPPHGPPSPFSSDLSDVHPTAAAPCSCFLPEHSPSSQACVKSPAGRGELRKVARGTPGPGRVGLLRNALAACTAAERRRCPRGRGAARPSAPGPFGTQGARAQPCPEPARSYGARSCSVPAAGTPAGKRGEAAGRRGRPRSARRLGWGLAEPHLHGRAGFYGSALRLNTTLGTSTAMPRDWGPFPALTR